MRLGHCYTILALNPQGCFTKPDGKSIPPAEATKKLDDMAQMIGSVIPVTQIAAAGEISAALDKRCAVLVPGVGAVVCGKDEDDTQALAVLADKAAVCFLQEN